MVRRAVFDPTDRELFIEQRHRFDWSLLQNGHVFRYDTGFELDNACDRLGGVGYLVHRIDAHPGTSVEDMYDALAETLSYRRSYGASLDALANVFADVGTYLFGSDPATTGTVLAIAGFDTLLGLDPRTAHVLLDNFARQARLAGLYGHPMLCLIETRATDLPPVGGIGIYRGSVWDAEPDPPRPFHPDDLLEYTLHVFTADVAGYLVALRAVLTDLLAPIGRWQISDPHRITDPTVIDDARANAHHRPHPLTSDDELWHIRIGIRGAGDENRLGDQLVHAHHDAGLHFEGLFSHLYTAGTTEHAQVSKMYPDLHD
ncbi:barstar family protein [Rhodococcus pyridinivorans]|uniref:barstar family protein n=1 Tax=Rhodococcus pyridinivorans TaxID=103816 RepID=UPI00265B03FA|nr:barstar family protein [Rhodococcus pyridinivorans]